MQYKLKKKIMRKYNDRWHRAGVNRSSSESIFTESFETDLS